MPAYPPEETVAAARARYFEANGFGVDGGYSKKWDWFKIGPLKMPIPNLPSRVYALQFHDLHHIATGYDTDWRGEFEIAAWEVGAGCKDAWFAWLINFGGLLGGVLLLPKRTWQAFVRGRRSRSLYGVAPEELLSLTVQRLREMSCPAGSGHSPNLQDGAALVFWSAIAGVFALALHAPLLAGVGLVWWWLR